MPDHRQGDKPGPGEGHVFGAVAVEEAWTPAVNIYESKAMLHVCVGLPGVERSAISVSVEPGRLVIEGRREMPEHESARTHCIHVMEIDHGRFRRTLALPDTVDLSGVRSSYREGLLWIDLPLKG